MRLLYTSTDPLEQSRRPEPYATLRFLHLRNLIGDSSVRGPCVCSGPVTRLRALESLQRRPRMAQRLSRPCRLCASLYLLSEYSCPALQLPLHLLCIAYAAGAYARAGITEDSCCFVCYARRGERPAIPEADVPRSLIKHGKSAVKNLHDYMKKKFRLPPSVLPELYSVRLQRLRAYRKKKPDWQPSAVSQLPDKGEWDAACDTAHGYQEVARENESEVRAHTHTHRHTHTLMSPTRALSLSVCIA